MLNLTRDLLPRWMRWLQWRPAMIDFGRFYMWCMLACLALLVAALIGSIWSAVQASASGTLPLERKQALCLELGYPLTCTIPYEPFWALADLSIAIDDYVSEPDVVPTVPDVYASSVTLTVWPNSPGAGLTVTQHYQHQATGYFPYVIPPCVFSEGCMGYDGPTEADLSDWLGVVTQILFRRPDAEITSQLQTAFGGTASWPLVDWVYWGDSTLVDNSGNEAASVFRVPVWVRFAVPGS